MQGSTSVRPTAIGCIPGNPVLSWTMRNASSLNKAIWWDVDVMKKYDNILLYSRNLGVYAYVRSLIRTWIDNGVEANSIPSLQTLRKSFAHAWVAYQVNIAINVVIGMLVESYRIL